MMESTSSSMNNQSTMFAKRMQDNFGSFMEILFACIGDKMGIFKDMAKNGPATVSELAKRNNVNERYMLEWLRGMHVAKYIMYDAGKKTYSIPPAHIPVLAQDFGRESMGGWMSFVESSFEVYPMVMQSFAKGGGVSYKEYPASMWDAMDRLTGGKYEMDMDEWFEKFDPNVKKQLMAGARVCDVGCGRGRALRNLAKRFPKSTFVGFEVYQPNVDMATMLAKQAGLQNISFSLIGINEKSLGEMFDIVFLFDVMHDTADPMGLLKCIRSSIKSTGTLLCLDMNCAEKPEDNAMVMYGFSLLFCMTTSLQQGGMGMGTCGLTEGVVRDMCGKAGFGSVRRVEMRFPDVMWEIKPSAMQASGSGSNGK